MADTADGAARYLLADGAYTAYTANGAARYLPTALVDLIGYDA